MCYVQGIWVKEVKPVACSERGYGIRTRRILQIPYEDKEGISRAAKTLTSFSDGLSSLGYKTKDRVGIRNSFTIAELHRAVKICETISRQEMIFLD